MKNTLETRLGLFFALALIAAVLILELIGAADFFKPGYRIHANFRNAQELKVGDQVKMAGVEIGRVDAIVLTNSAARITMKITKPEAGVNTDSRAVIRFTGLMGQNFIAIEPGSAPDAPRALEGAVLQSSEQPDLSTLMVKLESVATGVEGLTKSFSTDNLSTLMGPLTDFIKSNNERLSGMIANLRNVSDKIASGEGTVGKLIYDESLYTSALGAASKLETASTDLNVLLGEARTIVNQVNAGQGTLGKLTKDEALYTETTTAMTNLKEILEKINRGQGSVGKLVNDETFLKNIRMTLQKVDKATESLEDQGPLSVIGTAVQTLF